MKLQPALIATMAALFAAPAIAADAPAVAKPTAPKPEYVSIVLQSPVAKPADAAWKKISGFCDIGAWFKTTCTYTTGDGGVGTNRLIGGGINEVMVAQTALSYTYAQPLAPNSYHGTVEVRPDGAGSKIVYSLFYDASTLPDQAAKDKFKMSRTALFTGVVKTLKSIAEAP